jgi:hypothetical protein
MIYDVDFVTCATCLFITCLLACKVLLGIIHVITTSREKALLNKYYLTLDTPKVLSPLEDYAAEIGLGQQLQGLRLRQPSHMLSECLKFPPGFQQYRFVAPVGGSRHRKWHVQLSLIF